ncbi:DJ-1/PfpI family protein [Fulvivirga lutimaris]|uniref:DJ-1/PfpI family protein n=1 Tax=Fulvivirga lutimaris TaxID=1819566 RepID=UPI0012BBA9E8|nr:DJ-1/PfpI family protein [Fulvivirga lutimaris]MTI41375.1 glutamine amidotransferase [Fulvivirga lutimaris]
MKNLIYTFLVTVALLACNKIENKEVTNTVPELPAPIMPDKKLNVAFLIVDGVYNSELVAPMDILHHTVFHTEKGMSVFTVAPDSMMITSFEGLKITPDYSFLYDSLPNIDVLVVPSAEHSMDSDLENELLINFVKTTGGNAQYVMSLCDGAFVLAQAGLVNEKESTTFPSDIQRYKETFPQLTVHDGVSFVHDGKLITSVGGAKSYDPALYLSEILFGKKAAKGIAKGLVIDWNVEEIEFVRVQ